LIDSINSVGWISYQVVKEPNLKKRVSLVSRFLRVAKECIHLGNFNAVFEITSGLQQSSVHRLKQTWALVKKQEKDATIFSHLIDLTSGTGSFSSYRKQLHGANPPCVPYLGVYQSDLTFINDGNPDFLENGYINFFKRRLVAEVINEAQTYQQKPYNLKEVKSIIDWLRNSQEVSNLDENTIYSVSLIIEPREESPTVARKTNSLSRTKSGKLIKNKSLQQAPTHSSWTPDQIDSQSRYPGGSLPNKKTSKLSRFFGENADFEFYQKWSIAPDTSVPKSILSDTDTKPQLVSQNSIKPQLATSVLDLSPEQIATYKKQMVQQFHQDNKGLGADSQRSSQSDEYQSNTSGSYNQEDGTGWL